MSANARLKGESNHFNQNNEFAAKQFHYTFPGPKLSSAQREFYEKNGYLVIQKLVEDELLDACRERFVDLCEGKRPKNDMLFLKDMSLRESNAKGEFLYNKAQGITSDDVFYKYITCQPILDIVENIIGPNITAMHSMLINKPPDSGKQTSQHPLHQDLHYFPVEPADRIVGAWTAMENVTLDNGCLFVLPGTHKGVLEPHHYPDAQVNVLFHGVRGYDDRPKVNLLMEKGDTVFLHPLLVHGSGVNVTKGFRKAISCHYAASECHFIDIAGTIQEHLAKEAEKLAKSKGLNQTYMEYWKTNCRLVRGQQINL